MAINLHIKYSDKIATIFKRESFVDGRFSDQYSFSGVRTVKISTPVTVPYSDYNRSGANRYGTPVEMQDTLQELTMTQDKSFALTIDKGNNADQQGIKAAGRMMGLQVKEQGVPMKDTYSFGRLANLAGIIVGGAALAKSNVAERLADGVERLDNEEVPQDGRTLFVNPTTLKLVKLCPEWLNVDALGEKILAKGQVGNIYGMPVISVPTSRFPKHVNFIIAHRSSATAPTKIDDTKLHQDPPGLSGNLLEGRMYFDFFVVGARANGIYVDVDTSGAGVVLAAPTISATTGAITVASGAQAKYTLDGTDPRYSTTAVVGTAPTVSSGMTVRAYAYKTDGTAFASPVTTQTIS